MEKVIVVDHSEVVPGAKGEYLKVTDKGGKVQNIFDQSLWNLFVDGCAVKLNLEKTGNWWNVVKAEAVELPAEKPTTATGSPPMESFFSGEEKGMWWKELGNRIGDGSLDKHFPKNAVYIKSQYYKRMVEVTGIKFKEEEKTE